MKFFQTIRSSLYDPAFYRRMKEASAAQAVKYFALIVFIISLATTAWLGVSFSLWASTTGDLREWRDTALSLYPDELVLEYRDGRVVSNVEEPYFIPTPKGFHFDVEASRDARIPENLIVISTKAPVTPADFKLYDTSVILGGDSLWINDAGKGKIEIQTFTDWSRSPFTLDKKMLAGYADKLFEILKPIIIALFLFLPFILFGVFMSGYLVYLLFGALIIWIIGKIRNVDVTYGQSYKLGLYLMTAPILYSLFSDIVPHANIPFLFTLILAVFAYMNLVPAKEEDQSLANNGPKTDLQEIPTPAPIENPAGVSGEMKINPAKSDVSDAGTDNKPTDGK